MFYEVLIIRSSSVRILNDVILHASFFDRYLPLQVIVTAYVVLLNSTTCIRECIPTLSAISNIHICQSVFDIMNLSCDSSLLLQFPLIIFKLYSSSIYTCT